MVLLAALWGASFLFMRATVHEFGPIPLIAVRVALAAVFLLIVLAMRGGWAQLGDRFLDSVLVGVLNSALPFTLIAYSTLTITAGFASVLNALTPMFALFVAFVWFGDRFSVAKLLGMVVGLLGVVVLVWDRVGSRDDGALLAIGAGVLAAALYGVAANYTRARLQGINPLALATGSQIGASLALLPLAVVWWPETMPSQSAWYSAVALAIACTGLAYVIYFDLLEKVGADRATTVTFLIPVFGIFWGAMILDEVVTTRILVATAIILLGTMLATNVIRLPLTKVSSSDESS
ncbi:MAG: DMT family transporter [Pseudomonadota bacterium]